MTVADGLKPMGDPVQVSNGKFTLGGVPLVLKGFNLGSWLNIEDFMIGLSGTDGQLRAAFRDVLGAETAHRFFEAYADAFIIERDIRFVRDAGCNLVQLPFNYRYFESDDEPFVYREDAFRRIDRLMDWCDEIGVFVLLDFHAAPGGQNNTASSAPVPSSIGFLRRLWRDRWLATSSGPRATNSGLDWCMWITTRSSPHRKIPLIGIETSSPPTEPTSNIRT